MNRLLIKLENTEEAQYVRVQAYFDHVRLEYYNMSDDQSWQQTQLEVIKYKDHPDLEHIHDGGAWNLMALASLVDVFATDGCEDQTEVPGSPSQNWQATGNPDPSKAAEF